LSERFAFPLVSGGREGRDWSKVTTCASGEWERDPRGNVPRLWTHKSRICSWTPTPDDRPWLDYSVLTIAAHKPSIEAE
jgi:hypothetical protein